MTVLRLLNRPFRMLACALACLLLAGCSGIDPQSYAREQPEIGRAHV